VHEHDGKEKKMAGGYQRADYSGGTEKEKIAAERQSAADSDDTWRCKETSNMKAKELLKLMFRDLAFWKKAKKYDQRSPSMKPANQAGNGVYDQWVRNRYSSLLQGKKR
jgi:hypothetical protein